LSNQIDFLRWRLHQETLAYRIPDQNLTEQTGELAGRLVDTFMAMLTMAFDNVHESAPAFVDKMKPQLKAEIVAQLAPVFKGIRDLLEEPDRYPQTDIRPIIDTSN